jgi:4-amino-4-deoxy-L-arabinose transferase-like glycosyltransferase
MIFVRWLTTIWLGFIAVRYGSTAIRTLREPFNPGWDIGWAIAWITLLVAALLSAVLLKRSVMNAVWLGLGIASTLAILILSRTALPAAIALAVFGVSAGLGEYVFQKFKLTATGLLERLVIAAPVGIGVLALGQLLLGVAHLFNPVASWRMLVLLGLPAILGIRKLSALRLEIGSEKSSWVAVPIGYIFLLNLMWAASPEIQFDALNVHLAVPRLYLQQGALVNLPYFFHSYFAHLLDMLFGLCLALGGPLVAKFVVLGFGVLAAAGVYVAGRALFNDEVGRWAALIFYTTPLVIWLSTTTYMDLASALFVVASIVAFIRWCEDGGWGWLAASGWIAGVATGTKVAALTTLIVLPIFAVWHSRRVRALAVYLIPLLTIAIPWFLVVYVETGNPFFPYMNQVFRSPQWPFENPTFNARDFGFGTAAADLLKLPFRFTFNTVRFGDGLSRGGAGVALLLAVPFALTFIFRGRPAQRAVLAAIALHLTAWAFTFQYARYMIAVFPLLALMGCAVFLGESAGFLRLNRVLLFCCVLAQASIAPTLFLNIPERYPLQRALGLESEENFLARALPGYKAATLLNGVVKPDDKILGVGTEYLRFYLNAPLYTQAELKPFELYKDGIGPPHALAAWHNRNGFRYVLALQSDVQHPAPFYPFLQPRFLEQFGKQIYRDDAVAVVRIMPVAEPPIVQPDGRNAPNLRTPSPDDPIVARIVIQPRTVKFGESYTATFSGAHLTEKTYFDIQYRTPSSIEDDVLNWQQGVSAKHLVTSDTEQGEWIITGVRAHQDENDRTGSFAPISAAIRISP